MDSGRKIMYVGLQFSPSQDRPNNRPDRVWNGPGDVVVGVPPIQAHALCQHKDEWQDVTTLSDPDLLKAQRAARASSEERVRVLKNPKDAPNNRGFVAAMSDEDLEAELERRRDARGEMAQAPNPSKLTAPPTKRKPKGEAQLAEQIGGAVERVITKSSVDKETTLLDEEGVPTLAAVQEELGYSLSEDEYRNALGIRK